MVVRRPAAGSPSDGADTQRTGGRPIAVTKKRAGPLALEAALIVVSILLAFAIDAAWDGREEGRRGGELIAALHADFTRNQELLASARAAHESYRQAAQDFLALATPGSPRPGAAIPDATLIGLVSWYTYDPALGSLHSAIASGQLALIRDADLRVALAGWIDSVEDLNELETVDRGHAQRFAEIAFEYVPFRSAVVRLGAGDSLGRESTARPDYEGLLSSLRAENVATNRVAETGFILADMDRVEAELVTILDLLSSASD